MIPPGWCVIPLWRIRVIVFRMPQWGVLMTWRGRDGWWRQIWRWEK